jgi:hypothetical protein
MRSPETKFFEARPIEKPRSETSGNSDRFLAELRRSPARYWLSLKLNDRAERKSFSREKERSFVQRK